MKTTFRYRKKLPLIICLFTALLHVCPLFAENVQSADPVSEESAKLAADFPEKIYLKTATQSFNSRYYFVLRDHRIWCKPNEETTGKKGEWELFLGTGVPFGKQVVRFGEAGKIAAISSDGMYLIALSEDGCFYRGYNLYNKLQKFTWTDKWGGIGAKGPGLKIARDDFITWHVSDVFPMYVKYYTDSKGIRHSTGLGVAHIYLLGKNGSDIRYNDWWLPPDMSRKFNSPENGGIKVVNMSVSASTVFVITGNGNCYTRLYDLDVCGDDDLVTYSYFLDRKKPGIHGLPAPGWVKHTLVSEGKITEIITIYQSGKTSGDRILRVEGSINDTTGYFEKHLKDAKWLFRKTGLPLIGEPILYSPHDSLYERKRYSYSGILESNDRNVYIHIKNFNPDEAEATITLSITGKDSTEQQVVGEFPFPHLHRLERKVRDADYWEKGSPARIKASLIIRHYDKEKTVQCDRTLVQELFGNRRVIHFTGTVSKDGITLKELGSGFLMFPIEERALFPEWKLTGVKADR